MLLRVHSSVTSVVNAAGWFILEFILVILISSCSSNQAIKTQITDRLSKEKGTYAVAFKDLTTGKRILIHDKEFFHAASTIKTCILIEIYKQVSLGKLSLTDSLLIRNQFKSIVDGSPFVLNPESDSESSLYHAIGQRKSISTLAYLMITSSSNFATNLLIEKVGAKEVTGTMRELGAKDILVLRGVEDNLAYEKGLVNKTTAFDLMVIFEKLANGKVINQQASQAMIAILFDQKFNEVIPARLPKGVRVAHKTGNFASVLHDSGIVYGPHGKKYVLILLSKDLANDEASKAAMANVSEWIYTHVASPNNP